MGDYANSMQIVRRRLGIGISWLGIIARCLRCPLQPVCARYTMPSNEEEEYVVGDGRDAYFSRRIPLQRGTR